MKTFAFLIAASLSTPTSAFLATSSPAAVVANGVTINSRLSMASSSTGTDESVVPIVVTPNPVIKLAANGMSLLGPVFALEANLQAAVLGSLTNVDVEAVSSNIEYMKNTNDVLIYTYGLSPFSSEAMSMLDASGIEYTKIELGMEWFLLGGEGSVTRVALSKEVENGATSLPKRVIGGVCIGGCAELANLVESGELVEMVKRAKKVASTSKKGGGGKGGGGSGNFLTKMFM
jgi:glutaredoxin-related protein